MKKSLVTIIALIITVVGLGATLMLTSCSMRSLTGLFFNVNLEPVAIDVKDSYELRTADEKTKMIVEAANAFVNSLDKIQKQTVTYKFSDNAQRSNWSNFPEGMIPRGGLDLGVLSRKQRTLLETLLSQIMSPKGMENLNYQLAAEDTIPPSSILKYGSQNFYVALLGMPSNTQPWMFQFGGHHLAINVTIYGADVTFSPMLTGAQPAYIQYEGNNIFITQNELSAVQAFMNSLTQEQKKVAVRSDEVIDLQYGPGKYSKKVAFEGIKGSELKAEQKRLLFNLINTRIGFINENDYEAVKSTTLAELDDTYFGWWGSRNNLRFYFRITAPSLIIEYAPQEEKNKITHIHSMYRNPKNDYGSAWIR